MIDLINGTDSLTNFKRHTAEILDRLRTTGRPLVLTVQGKAELVVQDVASYQKLLERVERLESIEAVRQGLDETRAGKGRPAKEVLEEIRQKYSIPNDA